MEWEIGKRPVERGISNSVARGSDTGGVTRSREKTLNAFFSGIKKGLWKKGKDLGRGRCHLGGGAGSQ